MGIFSVRWARVIFLQIFLLFQSSSVLPWGNYDDIQRTFSRSRLTLPSTAHIWPNKTLSYIFDSNIDSYLQRLIHLAMADISNATCVRFARRTTEQHYVKFVKGIGCYSYVGLKGGEQKLSIGNDCRKKGIILHELMHALGFFHTHSRPDRDSNIVIKSGNILDGKDYYFVKYPQMTTLDSPYDFESILHPQKTVFSKNGDNTMEAIMNPAMPLGQINYLTPIDIQLINDLYKCKITGCYHALIGNRILPDKQFTASSTLYKYFPSEARLQNSPNLIGLGCWCPDPVKPSPWLEIDLGAIETIHAMATQGGKYTSGFVSTFVLEYSTNYVNWTVLHDMIGNFDEDSVRYTPLQIVARYITIYPVTGTYMPCIRVEFYGCRVGP